MAVHEISVQGQSTIAGKITGSETMMPAQQQRPFAQGADIDTYIEKYIYTYIHSEISNGTLSLASLRMLALAARQ